MLELKPAEFDWLRRVIKHAAGIHLSDGKEKVMRARLGKRLRAIGCQDFESYIAQIEGDASGAELSAMVDAVTVNQSSFFREPAHFPLFQRVVDRLLLQQQTINVWSAGCATGEEPYSLAMLAHARIANAHERIRFLATDVCSTALAFAREGVYPERSVRDIPEEFLQYLSPADNGRFGIRPELRNLIAFARHNLIGEWPMRGPMDIIFCRNVMMYFDPPTQRKLAARFGKLLVPGSYLFIGHSETLAAGNGFDYVQPSVYRKPEATR